MVLMAILVLYLGWCVVMIRTTKPTPVVLPVEVTEGEISEVIISGKIFKILEIEDENGMTDTQRKNVKTFLEGK
jgi:hypothetical protein